MSVNDRKNGGVQKARNAKTDKVATTQTTLAIATAERLHCARNVAVTVDENLPPARYFRVAGRGSPVSMSSPSATLARTSRVAQAQCLIASDSTTLTSRLSKYTSTLSTLWFSWKAQWVWWGQWKIDNNTTNNNKNRNFRVLLHFTYVVIFLK